MAESSDQQRSDSPDTAEPGHDPKGATALIRAAHADGGRPVSQQDAERALRSFKGWDLPVIGVNGKRVPLRPGAHVLLELDDEGRPKPFDGQVRVRAWLPPEGSRGRPFKKPMDGPLSWVRLQRHEREVLALVERLRRPPGPTPAQKVSLRKGRQEATRSKREKAQEKLEAIGMRDAGLAARGIPARRRAALIEKEGAGLSDRQVRRYLERLKKGK